MTMPSDLPITYCTACGWDRYGPAGPKHCPRCGAETEHDHGG